MEPATTPFRSIWTDLRTTSFRQGWIDCAGVNTRYIEAGRPDAPALIMVHGTGGSWECFCANVAAHAQEFHVFAYDCIGSGFTDKPDLDYEIPVYVQHLRDFMSAVGVRRASFIGVSLGAWIIARFALMHPDQVANAVLVSAAGLLSDRKTSADIAGARYKAVDDPSSANVTAIFKGLILEESNRIPDFAAIRQAVYRQPGMRRAMEHILCLQVPEIRERNLITEDEWRSLRTPLLVIGAIDHPDLFLETARQVSTLAPKAEYVEIARTSHWSQFESPEIFNRASLDFLRRTAS